VTESPISSIVEGEEARAMNIQITRPEVEVLIRQRLQTGIFASPEDVILDALRSSESDWPVPSQVTANSGEERARAFVLWAKSHRDTPPLSDEDISRANMYPDRW
jgi:hypothetical protein